jgi:glutamate-1-semialdehyde 2,1-aminomutase
MTPIFVVMPPLPLLRQARASEIAAVLISPLQGLNPGKPPPSDLVLMDSKMRATNDRVSDYTKWLQLLREVTTEYDIPLVFDEVYTGFRMAPGGAQEFYNVKVAEIDRWLGGVAEIDRWWR